MNELKLSERLTRVAEFVPEGSKMADIGSDHAYLPCYLCSRDKEMVAIAGEVNEGPYQLALNQVKRIGLSERIDVRKGNGLQVLKKNEVDVITIAGMGGGLITTILDEGKDKLEDVEKLVLQPNVAANVIRTWLSQNGWRLINEDILEEDDKIYEILVAKRGADLDIYQNDSERKLLMGPYLMKKPNEAFRKKWLKETVNWNQILTQIDQAKDCEQHTQRRSEITRKIQMVEEVLSW